MVLAAAGAGSCLLLIASWAGRAFTPESGLEADVLWGLSGAGAAGLVLVSFGSGAVRRLLERRPVQWLGRVSFSLYLVQAPVLATIAFAAGDDRWPLIAAVGIPATLLSRVVVPPGRRASEPPLREMARTTDCSPESALDEHRDDGCRPGP